MDYGEVPVVLPYGWRTSDGWLPTLLPTSGGLVWWASGPNVLLRVDFVSDAKMYACTVEITGINPATTFLADVQQILAWTELHARLY